MGHGKRRVQSCCQEWLAGELWQLIGLADRVKGQKERLRLAFSLGWLIGISELVSKLDTVINSMHRQTETLVPCPVKWCSTQSPSDVPASWSAQAAADLWGNSILMVSNHMNQMIKRKWRGQKDVGSQQDE